LPHRFIDMEEEEFVFGHEKHERIYPKALRKLLVEKEEKEVIYSKTKIPIGKDKLGRIVYLCLENPIRAIILGLTRSGKSVFLRAMLDRLVKSGHYIGIYLTDIKREFWTSRMPLQPKFHHKLIEGEKPCGIKVVSLRPTLFESKDKGGLKEHDHPYSINPSKMSSADINTLVSTLKMPSAMQNLMQVILNRMDKDFDGNKDEFRMEWFEKAIDELEGATEQQRRALRMRFQPLFNSNFYKPEHDLDITELMANGWIPTINMERFDEFYGSNFNPPPVVVSLVLRQIINARREKKIKEVFVMIDEMSRFVPAQDRGICSRHDILEAIDVSTALSVSIIGATQNLSKIPEQVVKQCRYIFLPYNTDMDTLIATLKMCGVINTPQGAYKQAKRIKDQMKKWDWIMIDRNNIRNPVQVIEIFLPLSRILESRE